MATTGFVRKPRISPPRAPGGEVAVQPPPDVPRVIPGSIMMKMLPIVMILAVVGMVAMMFTVGGRSMLTNPMMLMFPMIMVMSTVGMFMGGGRGGGKRAAELNEERKDYFRYLAQLREDVQATGKTQRQALEWSHPEPKALQGVVGSRRMWERRPGDHDFGHVRVGVGNQRLASRLMPPETGPLEDLEPVSTVALRRFVRTYSVVHRLPTSVSLRGFPAISVEGIRQETRGLMRSMVMELCAFHGPDHLRILIVCADPEAESWSWTKWLPHVHHPTRRDAVGAERMLYGSVAEAEEAIGSDLMDRGRFSRTTPPTPGRMHYVVVIDDGYVNGDERLISDAGMDGVSILDLTAAPDGLAARRGLQLIVRDGTVAARSAAGDETFADIDTISVPDAEVFARAMSRYRIATAAQIVSLEQDSTPSDPGLMALLKIPDANRIDPAVVWRPRTPRERLRVPIGVSQNGSPVELDIKEAAENGMGPHGLCIGATGSGKSEFLRTLVLSLIATHSPDALNLVLVDFKGGATFLGLDAAPHVAAVITNLEDELSMVDRMKDALSGEMNRRQELLRSAGNFANVGDYERARAAGKPLDPLPALFIVVDEFSELLSQKPDFAELFVAIGRLGRSLHMHLLLASQRLEEGKLRGLDSHLSYRIGLKTFSANESRTVLGVPDAYHLPSVPGSAYLKCDSADPVRFNASYVSGPYTTPDSVEAASPEHQGQSHMKMFTAGRVAIDWDDQIPQKTTPSGLPSLEELEAPLATGPAVGPTLLDVVVSRLAGHGRAAHEVWLPPLNESPTVDMLVPFADWREGVNTLGDLRFHIGVVDRPYDQRRDVLILDVGGAAGNIAIVGGPQSGKSTALRTTIMSAAATHTPEQVQFYCLDLGGGTLSGLAELPHVGTVATRSDADGVRRSVAELATLLREREERFRELGIESMRDFRKRKAAIFANTDATSQDPVAQDAFGDVFLIIDGWAAFRADFEPLETTVTTLINQGLTYGIHVVLTASRWGEIRPAIKDLIGSRLELRLGDPMESDMARKVAALVPSARPGRGISAEALHLLVGLPRLDGESDPESLTEAVAWSVDQLRRVYPGRQARKVRKLSLGLQRAEVYQRARELGLSLGTQQIPVGLGENELAPLVLDFDAQPLLFAFADNESGKTTLLRNIAMGLMEQGEGTQNKIVLVDYRRTMLGAVEGDHLAGYATSAQALGPMMKQLHQFFTNRLPGPDLTQQQLRDRSWWQGPNVHILVDDYDMVASASSGNPLSVLGELLPSARDIGLRLVICRRSGGASRALFDPVIGKLKDLSSDILLMSGDRDEGNIVGRTKMQKLPPGRGEFISRARGHEMVQISNLPPLI
ncbi:type VII secretion protein EccCa [Gordonia sp. SID5947]|uniref:type VII secretion protein EccCa n=1 Tax=Gordonia sp. SID5947 TaxID=2690315 RepID=UPI00136C50CE|nr:type VII secretion protein EccCa [Gordonia sp. SID5947]MYR07530.1 type VII secretion protein EccCa [Gordonia sp. SID5947]